MHKTLALTMVLCACGGDKEEARGSSAPASASEPAREPARPESAVTPEPAKPAPVAPAPAASPEASKGTCKVTATGGVTLEQTSEHGGGRTLNVMQWHTPEMRTRMGYKDHGMILNCGGKDIRLSILTNKELAPGKLSVGGKGGDVRLLGEFPGEKASIMKSAGTLEITAFDDQRIAGTLDATVTTLPARGDITLHVTFDLQCYGLSGCK